MIASPPVVPVVATGAGTVPGVLESKESSVLVFVSP